MNILAFTVLVLIAVTQTALAIRCHQCQPDYNKVIPQLQNVNGSGPGVVSFCNKPTDTFDCSQDPMIGNTADSCYTVNVTLNTTYGVDLHVNVLNCSVKSMCSSLKGDMCGMLGSIFEGMPEIGMKSCDVKCCEGDLCNNPSGSAATTTPTTPTVKSSAKITSIPPNAALFAILALFTLMSFMNLF